VPLRYQQRSFSRPAQPKFASKPAGMVSRAQLKRGFVLAITVIAGISLMPLPAAADEAPVAFIRALGNQAVSVIHSEMQRDPLRDAA